MTGSVAVDLLAKTHFPFTLWSNMILPSVLGVKDAHSLDADTGGKILEGSLFANVSVSDHNCELAPPVLKYLS